MENKSDLGRRKSLANEARRPFVPQEWLSIQARILWKNNWP